MGRRGAAPGAHRWAGGREGCLWCKLARLGAAPRPLTSPWSSAPMVACRTRVRTPSDGPHIGMRLRNVRVSTLEGRPLRPRERDWRVDEVDSRMGSVGRRSRAQPHHTLAVSKCVFGGPRPPPPAKTKPAPLPCHQTSLRSAPKGTSIPSPPSSLLRF